MAYKKGQLEFGAVTDSQTEDYDRGEWLHLPHSCEEWVIGGREQAEQLIHDLQEKLKNKEIV